MEEIDKIEEGSEQTLLEHLNELRIRLTWSAGFLVFFTIISFVFAEQLLGFLLTPYATNSPIGELQTIRPTEGIETFFKVALMAGFALSMPFLLHQLWLFISPGLTKQERRYVYIFIPSALLLFVIGVSFAWFVLVPAAINFLANFLPEIFRTEWTGQDYIGFIISMVLWLGVSFEMPIVVYFVARVGIVTAKTLREQWRVAVVGVAVLAAAITPSIDPVTMLLTMAPLLVLYLLSILLAYVGQRQFEKSVAID
ncbi:MAG: twin-arginine translocase subunit TatC [Candidatus Promineifilaceae bacterium]